AHRAHSLFESQVASEKRKLLDFVVSNCRWKAGRLEAEYRQPFNLIALARNSGYDLTPDRGSEITNFDNWRRERDSNPRASYPANGFQDRRFQPLTHSSADFSLPDQDPACKLTRR